MLLAAVVVSAAAGAVAGDTLLLAAAARIFKVSRADFTLRHVRTLDMYRQGFVFDTYDGVRSSGETVGRFARLQVFTKPGSTIDLALAVEKGRVTTAVEVRPVTFSGRRFSLVPRMLEKLGHREIGEMAPGVSAFLRALPRALEADHGPPVEPAPPSVTPTIRWLEVTQPELPLGRALPPIDALDLAGRPVKTADLKERRVMIAVGDFGDSVTRDMLIVLSYLTRARPGLELIALLANTPAQLRGIHAGRADLAAARDRAIADPDKKLAAPLLAPVSPYLFVFDRKHKLVYRNFWCGGDCVTRDLDALPEEN